MNPFEIHRDEFGVPHITAETTGALFRGLGYAHGRDRGMQAIFMRILGQGRVSELLDSSEASLGIDRFFRRMNWSGRMEGHMDRLTETATTMLTEYSNGINEALGKKSPWEFSLLGYKPEPWKPEDTLLVVRMTGYLTLAQSQAEMERFFVEMVQAGVPDKQLAELFGGILGGMDRELIEGVELQEPYVVPGDLWGVGAPRMMASNNWVISGDLTDTGAPVLANDPHLETNRLPNIWYEVALNCGDHWGVGASMPGIPGLLVGRTDKIAVGATYSFLDATDSWIERCKDGMHFRSDAGWVPFSTRNETIHRKKKAPEEVVFHENLHGVVEGDPTGSSEKHLLCTRWSAAEAGAESVNAIAAIWEASTVSEAMAAIGPAGISFNWVFADTNGDIGYQMSGWAPKRKRNHSGFVPLAGWDPANDWNGYIDWKDLPSEYNPKRGYIVTSNQDLNHLGKARVINMPMAPYRADRIEELLTSKDKLRASQMNQIQGDLYSLEAREFMEILRPLLPDTADSKLLCDWNLCYEPDSKGAFLFERFYERLRSEVFGRKGFGDEAEFFISRQTGVYADFYLNFNRVLLSRKSEWFGGENRDELYQRIAVEILDGTVQEWGSSREVQMAHIIFGGQLPGFVGFDRGPVVLPGSRATVNQGQIYRSAGRTTTFAPSLRFATDMREPRAYTNSSGGPSDRRFSKWYFSNMERWQNNEYKTLSADPKTATLPF